MPSWCHNILDVWGPEGSPHLEAFARAAASGEQGVLTLNAIRPQPTSIDGAAAVIQWRHLHWGTKWDIENATAERRGAGIRFRFLSAWAGPTYWCEYASALYPSLTLRLTYVSPDEGRATTMSFSQGALIASDEVGPSAESDIGGPARLDDLLRAARADELRDLLA